MPFRKLHVIPFIDCFLTTADTRSPGKIDEKAASDLSIPGLASFFHKSKQYNKKDAKLCLTICNEV